MDGVLEETRALSAIGHWDEVIRILDSHFDSSKRSMASAVALADPDADYLPAMYFSLAAVEIRGFDREILDDVEAIISSAETMHVDLAPGKYCRLALYYSEYCISQNELERVIPILRTAIQKIQTAHEGMLTSIHSNFVFSCLRLRQYEAALPIVLRPVFKIVPDSGMNSYRVLSFFYYSGIILSNLKMFPEAFNMVASALSVPARVISAVQVAAYKKYIFLSFICHGNYIEPKSIPSALLKKLSSFCLPHTEFIKVAQNSFDDAKSLIISNSKTLQRERNLGLARLALTALKRKRIKILATVYKTLTIEKLAQLSHFADVSDVQHVLLDMVNKGEICAEFDKETNIVTFFDEQEPDASVNLMKKLREKVSASHSFLTDLRKMADSASSDLSFMQMIANLDLYFNLDGATSSLGTK